MKSLCSWNTLAHPYPAKNHVDKVGDYESVIEKFVVETDSSNGMRLPIIPRFEKDQFFVTVLEPVENVDE